MESKGLVMQGTQNVAQELAPIFPTRSRWNGLTTANRSALMSAATMINLNCGDQVNSGLGILISGVLSVEKELSDGRRALCVLFHEGDLVDLRRTERARQGNLIAIKDSEFLALDEDQTAAWIAKCPDIAGMFIAEFGEHLARMRDHVTDIAFKTPLECLASVLFEFRRWPGVRLGVLQSGAFRVPISRGNIADYIGVKPETVSRAIRQLEREGLIDIPEPDQVFITNVPAMRCLANGGRPRQSTRKN